MFVSVSRKEQTDTADENLTALLEETTILSSSGDYVSVIYTLDDYYQIDDITVKGEGSSVEIMQSADRNTFFSNGFFAFEDGVSKSYGSAGRNTRYIKIVIHKGNYDKISLNKIEFRGRKVYNAGSEQKSTMMPVRLNTYLKSNNILYLDWTGYNGKENGAVKYKVYIEPENITVNNILLKKPKATYCGNSIDINDTTTEKFVSYQGLAPETKYYITVIPVNSNGEANISDFDVTTITTYDVLGSGAGGSVFCVNDYPYTESVDIVEGVNDRENRIQNINIKTKLLAEMEGVSRTRWYNQSDEMFRRYGSKGIGYLVSVVDGYIDLDNQFGSYLFDSINEPNLKGSVYYENFAQLIKDIKEKKNVINEVDTRNLLAAPVLSNVDEYSMRYLKNLYNEDSRVDEYYEILDVHPYVQLEGGYMKGIEEAKTVPEHMIGKIDLLKDTMAELSIDKPIIFSEIGWTTATSRQNNYWAELLSEEMQAKFIPRAYIICMANGISNVYYYSFQDAAYIDKDPEHRFGMVDFYGIPKPSYYTYYTMVKILKNAEFVSDISTEENKSVLYPVYGYSFWDESNNLNILTLWNASGEKTTVNVFSTEPVTVVDAYGNTEELAQDRVLMVESDVKYILSKGKMKLL